MTCNSFSYDCVCQETGIAQSVEQLGYGLDDGEVWFLFQVGAANLYILHKVQTGAGADPASYTMDIRDCFPGDKTAGA
jgi:hypothetical protein